MSNCHWGLIAICYKDKTIEYYDSKGWKGGQFIDDITNYLKAAYLHQKGKELDLSEFKFDPHKTGIPKQVNNNDCGVFLLKVSRLNGHTL